MNFEHMLHHWILDENDEPKAVSLMEWAHWFERGKRRTLKQTFLLGGRIMISTVFLGIDHSFMDEGPPILWETMVFPGDFGDQYMDRYSSKQAALEGHEKAVGWARRHELSLVWHLISERLQSQWKKVRSAKWTSKTLNALASVKGLRQ